MADPFFKHISCRKEPGILVIVLTDAKIQGDDLADSIRQSLLAAVSHHAVNKVIIDFHNVTYLRSAGFRPLLSLHRKLNETRGRMVFCNLSPEILEVFTVTRLISSTRSNSAPFERAVDLADALARFRHHTSRIEQDVLVIRLTESRLHGDDLADDLNEEMLATVSGTASTRVVLDFTDVEALSTACLRPLLNLRKDLQSKGGKLVLCNLRPLVAEVMSATRLINSGNAGPAPLDAAADVAAAIAVAKLP
ncbi:MAG: STAS domain-containing protein [Planctomycetes bacterium]|nr:STAS domain-containing protein [Planctomycetota bacterium]